MKKSSPQLFAIIVHFLYVSVMHSCIIVKPRRFVETSSTRSDYFALQKISRPFRCFSSSQKVTLGSAARL